MSTTEQYAGAAGGAVAPGRVEAATARPVWRAEATIGAAAAVALATWLMSGAFRWQGYPVEHPYGIVVAAVVTAAMVTVLAAIGRLAIWPLPGLRPVLVALAGWTVVRLTFTSMFPLISDEAYHWMWGKYLDLAYFDHPGMVAWMGRLFAPLHGNPAALARLSSILLGAGIVLLTYALAKMTTGNARVAGRAALAVMLVPMYAIGCMLLVPSVALNLFWMATLAFVWRAVRRDRLIDWVLAGLTCGGALNANLTGFGLPVCVLGYLLISPSARRLLLRPGPYVALVAALVAFLPALIWNARHDWITITWNLYYRHDPSGFKPQWLTVYLVELLAFLSPVMTLLGLWIAGAMAWRGWRRRDEPMLYLAVMALAPLLAWAAISSTKLIVAYYAAPGFIPLIILCARGCVDDAGDLRPDRRGWWYTHAVGVANIFTAAAFVALVVPVFVPAGTMAGVLKGISLRGAEKRIAQVYGWPALADYIESQAPRIDADTPLVVVGPSYAQASSAMYYVRNLEMAYSLDEGVGRYGQQFIFWAPREQMPLGCDAILFEAGEPKYLDPGEPGLAACFERLEVVRPEGDPRMRYWTILRGYGYKGGLDAYPRRRPKVPIPQ